MTTLYTWVLQKLVELKGTIKSAIGVGSLLADGIGDTIRISLTGDPTEEIPVAKEILRSLDILNDKIKIVSCPTCGRCNINLIDLASEVEEKISSIDKDITVAIMGCAVNGPGEARKLILVLQVETRLVCSLRRGNHKKNPSGNYS